MMQSRLPIVLVAAGCLLPAMTYATTETAAVAVDGPPTSPRLLQEAVAEAVDILEGRGLPLDEAAARRTVIAALAAVGDPGSRVLTAEEYRHRAETGAGMAWETGIHFTRSNRFAVVTAVDDGSPAADAGIAAGDIVVRVGGEETVRMDVAQLQRALRADPPEQLDVAVRRGAADPVVHSLVRRQARMKPVEEAIRLPAGLGYLRINGFFAGAGAALADRLAEWSLDGVAGVVMDLRGANGDHLDSVVTVASLLASPGDLLFRYRDADGRDLQTYPAVAGASLGVPLMLLIDGQTTGAAELLAAVLGGAGRGAMLIGAPTAGDPLIRDAVPLSDGSVLYVASRRLVVGDGAMYGGAESVRPDIVVSPQAIYPDFDPAEPILTDPRAVTEEELESRELRQYIKGDVPLTRAVDVLLGLKALNLARVDHDGPNRP